MLYCTKLKKGTLIHFSNQGLCRIVSRGVYGYGILTLKTNEWAWLYDNYMSTYGVRLATKTERLLYG